MVCFFAPDDFRSRGWWLRVSCVVLFCKQIGSFGFVYDYGFPAWFCLIAVIFIGLEIRKQYRRFFKKGSAKFLGEPFTSPPSPLLRNLFVLVLACPALPTHPLERPRMWLPFVLPLCVNTYIHTILCVSLL